MRRPAKPVLEIERLPDGGIMMDRDNAFELFRYIIELEAGYEF